jgi:hypothetical protein
MGDWVDDLRQWRSGVRLMIASRALYQNHRSFPCLAHIIFSGESYSERASEHGFDTHIDTSLGIWEIEYKGHGDDF